MSPERTEGPVGRVSGVEDRFYADGTTEPAREHVDWRKCCSVECCGFGEVIAVQPHLGTNIRVVGHDDDRATGNAAEFANAALLLIISVVNRQDSHRCIDAEVSQGKRGCGSPQCWREVG